MNILGIDTSTEVMGVAIFKDNQLCGEIVTNLPKNHSVRLMPTIDYLMREVEMSPTCLNQIVVGKGPGSYTGVRIGLSTAKSMAWALQIPIVGVSSLEMLAYQGRNGNGYICPFVDARRDAVFTALYKWIDGQIVSVVEDQHIKINDWLAKLKHRGKLVTFLSPNLSLHKQLINEVLGELAHFPDHAYHYGRPSDLILAGVHKQPDNVHTLAPQYLRLAEAEANWLKQQKEAKQND